MSTKKRESSRIHPRAIVHPEWSKDAIIYEVNIRQFTPEGTFEAFRRHIPRLKELGIKILWLMPVHPVGDQNRKGSLGSYYAVKDYYAVNEEFGSAEDFREMIEEIHEAGMYAIIDWVPNHSSPDNQLTVEHPEWYQKDHDGNFIRPIGTSWSDVIAFDYDQEGLRRYMKDAMLYWVTEYNIDGFRCDVAGYVPIDFWREVRYELDLEKEVFLLAEWEDRLMHQAFDMTYAWELSDRMRKVVNDTVGAAPLTDYLANHINAWEIDEIRMNHTSNHDQNSWEGTVFDRFGKAAEIFAVFSYVIEGMPLIYGGQEVGLSKQLRFFEKDTIKWGDHPFNSLYARLGKLKVDNPALWNGKWGGRLRIIETENPEQVLAFTRSREDNIILGCFNFSPEPATFTITDFPYDSASFKSFSSRSTVDNPDGKRMELPGWGYEILIAN